MNDNPPFFKQALYTFRISESLTVNSPISNAIEAEDADENVLFYMLNGNVSALEYFRLSSDTNPVVLVNKSLDYDDCSTLYLNLTVRDTQIPGAVPSHTATTSIVIDITDADDKPPFFLPCKGIASKICISDGYTGNVNRNEQVSGPLTLAPGPLYAVDGDWGIGAPVEYAIISGNNDNVFNVDKTSGNITMNKAIDALGIIFLQVMASQTDDQLKYSTTSVVIEVKEKNSFPPTFEKSIYYGFILSNYATDTLVSDLNDRNKPLVVFAADDDFPDKLNPSLVYKIDNSTDFRILREGFIMTNVAITTPGIIQLQVSATDSSTNEMTSTMVSVEVIAAATTVPTTTTTTTSSSTGTGTTTTITPGTGTTITTVKDTDVVENDIVFTVTDMAALGASLGAILALCLVALGFLIHKQYGGSIKRKLMKGSGDNFGSTGDRTEQLINDIDDSTNDPIDFGGSSFEESASTRVTMATAVAVTSTPLQSVPDDDQLSETAEQADDSDDKKVKSILTKELKEDVGYKSVWFREDAAPEVVVIEGVEDGEADDNDSEEDYNDQQEDDGDDDEEDLDPTFNATDDMSQNSIL
ncbi:cadherin-related family member 5-like isoform 2-T2 [Mantella aurantiaca]